MQHIKYPSASFDVEYRLSSGHYVLVQWPDDILYSR